MPIKKVYRKRRGMGRKRAYRPKRRYAYRKNVTKLSTAIVPDKALVKFPYILSKNMATMGGASRMTSIRLNSLYDPDSSGIGHQPLGTDQWAAFYQRYRVYKVTYDITVCAINETCPAGIVAVRTSKFENGIDTDWYEQPRTRRKVIGNGAGQNRVNFRGSVNIPHVLGLSALQYKTETPTSATFSDSPNIEAFMLIGVSPFDVNANYTGFQVFAKLTYHAELFNRLELSLSNESGGLEGNPSYTGGADWSPSMVVG